MIRKEKKLIKNLNYFFDIYKFFLIYLFTKFFVLNKQGKKKIKFMYRPGSSLSKAK